MAKATAKSPAINALLEDITGRDRVSTIGSDKCMTCGGPADDFRDELSRKEYSISGMCQRCQDSVFGSTED